MNKVRSMYLYICLTLTILAGLAFFVLKPFSAEAADTHDHSGWKEWTSTNSMPTEPGSYYLTDNVTLSGTWTAPQGTTDLCLNGYNITRSGSDCISVLIGSSLNIYDCQDKGTIKGSNGVSINGGSVTVYGGTIAATGDSGIILRGSGGVVDTLTIHGGTITSTARHSIFTETKNTTNAIITIDGGMITCSISGQAVLYLNGSDTVSISGGIISNDKESGLYIGGSCRATITGGTFIGKNYGIKNLDNSTMNITNATVIGTSLGALLNQGNGTITIEGGSFSGIYGISNTGGTVYLSGSPTFTGSTADIYLGSGKKINITGTLGNTTPYSAATATNPTASSPVEITNSSNTSYNNAARFTSKNSSYIVRKNSNTQLELAVLTNPCTVTFDYKDGVTAVKTVTYESGDEYGELPVPTRTGYIFKGWYTDTDGKGTKIESTDNVNENLTLYAYWEAETSGDNTGGDNTDPSEGNDAGNITVDSESGENAPAVSIDSDTASRLEEEVYSQLAPDEREAIDNGSYLNVILRVEDAGDTVPVSDQKTAEAVIAGSDHTLGQYLNIDILKFIDGQAAGKITRLNSPISITIEVPENMRSASRAFMIVRIHEGKADTLIDIDSDPDTITILTDKFSTYAIAYQDGGDNTDIGGTEPPAAETTQTVPSYPSGGGVSGGGAPGIAPAGSSFPETVTVNAENKVTGETKRVRAVRNGDNVTVDLGKENDGRYANIYEKDRGFIITVLIEKGKARFTLAKDVDFSIVIDSYAHGEDVSAGAGIYSARDMAEDAVPVVGVTVPMTVSAVLIMKLRRKRNG